ncbi:MAG TPA: hypothetical protein VHB47_11025 [Thermoanaerobaculia bacterium]|nr:hypothetical protein [Thermoanaerobaculia bacterium]
MRPLTLRLWLLQGFGWALLAVAFALAAIARSAQELSIASRLVLASLGGLVGASGLALVNTVRKARTLDAETLRAQDRRAPVLYLRAFASDQRLSQVPAGGMLFGVRTEEEQIGTVMSEIGPFVAIGKPEEKLPELGAARMYAQDDHWREVVTRYLAEARLVVLSVGISTGLWWEIEQALALLAPRQLIVLILTRRKLYEDFRQRLQGYLRYPLPQYRGQGLLYFEPDWKPVYLKLKPPVGRVSINQRLAPTLKMAMQPVFEQLGSPWEPPPILWKMFLWSGLGLLAVALSLFFLWLGS